MNQEIFTNPEYIELVFELLSREEETPPPADAESGDTEVLQRVRRKILLRMKHRHTEQQGA